jgi:hypothetical protein
VWRNAVTSTCGGALPNARSRILSERPRYGGRSARALSGLIDQSQGYDQALVNERVLTRLGDGSVDVEVEGSGSEEENMSNIALSHKAAKLMKLCDLEGYRRLYELLEHSYCSFRMPSVLAIVTTTLRVIKIICAQ